MLRDFNQGIDGDFDDEHGTQDSGFHDDFNYELDDAARDETEESVLIFVLRLILSHALQEAFDVLEHHQMKNGQRKAPSLRGQNILNADVLLASRSLLVDRHLDVWCLLGLLL